MTPDTATEATRAERVQQVVRWVQDTEHKHLMHGDRRDPVFLPFIPYQPADFLAVMLDCVAEASGSRFLDIGAGPGTKMALAAELFGLEAHGIEIDKDMALTASSVGQVVVRDALGVSDAYVREFDIVWMYRPFRDPHFEHQLEQQVMDAMNPGAILAGGQWEMEKPPAGWITIVDDWDGGAKRGAWMKPAS